MRSVLFLSMFPLFLMLATTLQADSAEGDKVWLYVGTYTGKSKGIYRCEFDTKTGKIGTPELAAEAANASFLALSPNGKFLYCVNEIDNLNGKNSGGVQAFALDPKTGKLTLLNQQPTQGGGPCHLIVDKAGKNVLAANYGGGSVCVIPIKEDGSLAAPSSFIQHKGTSVDPGRQEGPHAHSVNLDANNHFAFVADLGLDKVLVYKFDPAKGTITPNDPPFFSLPPGSGPRHFAFHPNGKIAYVINEMKNTVTAMEYDAKTGTLMKLQTLPTLPADFKGNNSTAEVVVHPSGDFLYGSNRGHNSIASFKIDPKTGELTATGHQTEGIKTPRNFNIDPTGKFLVVANQDGASLVVFSIDPKTGELKPTGQTVEIANPVCVKFLRKGS
jgi:6-phosphogluconolactonase